MEMKQVSDNCFGVLPWETPGTPCPYNVAKANRLEVEDWTRFGIWRFLKARNDSDTHRPPTTPGKRQLLRSGYNGHLVGARMKIARGRLNAQPHRGRGHWPGRAAYRPRLAPSNERIRWSGRAVPYRSGIIIPGRRGVRWRLLAHATVSEKYWSGMTAMT